MTRQEATELLDKYFAGTCTADEYRMLIHAYNEEIQVDSAEPSAEDYEASKAIILKRLEQQYPQIRTKTVRIWPRIAGIAAAVTALALCIYFFRVPNDSGVKKGELSVAEVHDVEPGKNTATLTLANGKTIELSDQKQGVIIGATLTYDDQSSVFSEEEPDLQNTTLTAATPRGGTYGFTLPDGTKVWLNADSKISFPNRFLGDSRVVSLDGEAYFEVEKDISRPFIVKTSGQEIIVHGTHFNVKSYSDEAEVKTTLLEGSVTVSPTGRPARRLSPGQQAVVTQSGFRVIDANPFMDIAWKNGDFFFSGQDMEEVMRTIGRWYDVTVEYKVTPKNIRLEGEVSRSKRLSAILKVLESTSDSKFTIVGKKVIVH